jgi:hypothetical protein
MASSAPKIAEEERHEAAEAVDRKAQALVNQITKSKHFIAFTGAGISTSAGKFHQSYILIQSTEHVQVFLTFAARKAPGRSELKEESALKRLSTRCKLFRRLLIWHLLSCRTGGF